MHRGPLEPHPVFIGLTITAGVSYEAMDEFRTVGRLDGGWPETALEGKRARDPHRDGVVDYNATAGQSRSHVRASGIKRPTR
jgi:hypothetical protein